ncbi:DUF7344 domain-containing protein [Natronolimnohabitans innermongolicus]|uniref:DUF7344 domain-containing protein n=1 Tax=Natronolimnohabitans innermongolicus JCM 12255 TaxID=1227499 RepID=L9X092_9EURY|nr:hypothetical protein [Natronolimnohabitans innermongolicus]ELY55042.1 hypothetical protein C493_11862 [Natronolimnohabitans innermongolicus JCM 12255]
MTIHTDRLTNASDRRGRRGTDLPATFVDDSIPTAAVRRLLSNERRRAVVDALLETDEPLAIHQLVARLADAEHDATAVTSLHELRQRIHVSLCRTHLPLLENHRVVDYDPENGRVTPGARLSAVGSLLEVDLDGLE